MRYMRENGFGRIGSIDIFRGGEKNSYRGGGREREGTHPQGLCFPWTLTLSCFSVYYFVKPLIER